MAEEGDSGHRGAFSVEVCGGTHVHATGQVGTLLVLGESGIGGGMRRIEALTGRAAEQLFIEQSDQLDRLAQRLQTPVIDLETRLDSFIEDAEQVRRRLSTLERESLRREAQELLEGVADVDGVKVLAGRTSASNAEAMREMGDFLKTRLESAVLVMGGIVDDRPTLVAMVTDDLVASGLHAGNIVKEARSGDGRWRRWASQPRPSRRQACRSPRRLPAERGRHRATHPLAGMMGRLP